MEKYDIILKIARELIRNEIHPIANMSNLSSLIFEKVNSLNWVGFYLLSGNELILGPFQGRTACIRIKVGQGVCGKSIELKQTLIVPNVHKFDGHIACDSRSNSEIVIPIIKDNHIYGIMDIDSPIFDRFASEEKYFFEKIVKLFLEFSDVTLLKKIY